MNEDKQKKSDQKKRDQREHAPDISKNPSDDERLKEREWESFPASDPPPHSPGRTQKEAEQQMSRALYY